MLTNPINSKHKHNSGKTPAVVLASEQTLKDQANPGSPEAIQLKEEGNRLFFSEKVQRGDREIHKSNRPLWLMARTPFSMRIMRHRIGLSRNS